ncbi:MAG: recombinase RecT [Vannielia sp.]|uniref:ribosome modulation factor n=1 Tax=Vannielia sp. TaxID=2813045 RepID=UPI003B8B4534
MNDQTQKTDIMTREKRRQELGETQFSTGSQGGALMQPRNGKELMDMANMMSASGQMVRDFYRGNPGDCAALIMICQPYGFNPFMTSWKTYKASKSADAPVSFEGQLVNAMVNQSAPVRGRLRYTYDGEGPTRRCTVIGIDRETGEEITYTSPMLKDIKIQNSPLWKADPDQQLGYYSARSWARRHFPELLLGVYTREEIEEAPIRDITPKQGGFAARAGQVQEPQESRQEPDQPLDGEIMPEDVDQDGGTHWTAGLDLSDAFPGDDAFTEGCKAFKAGEDITDCPYDGDHEKAVNWCGGWDQTRKLKEEADDAENS